ncbi:MAG: CBS domain-containing protein [Candidatus Altiarchaeota archaeon]
MSKARDIMSSPVVTVEVASSVREAAKLMASRGIGCVIVKQGDNVAGILTERDLLTKVVAGRLNPDETKVSEVMTKDVVTVDSDADLFEVNNIFHEHGIRRLPVVEAGDVVGIITSRNILKNLKDVRARKFVSKEYSRPEFKWDTPR